MLIFGDVEPDSISLSPRNHIVWAEAAPKVAAGLLQGIFIECSYNDTQSDKILFGHLAPRHVIAELQTLADMVVEKKKELSDKAGKKRKRLSAHLSSGRTRSQREANKASHWSNAAGESPMRDIVQEESEPGGAPPATPSGPAKVEAPLKGVKIIIIHVKDSMLDGPPVGVSVLQDLEAHEERLGREGRDLGCSFEISRSGASYEV
jgi:cAMP phosphodiesterase